jgi:hypothetical protein
MASNRRCLGCNQPTRNGPRCPTCTKTRRQQYDQPSWRHLSKTVRATQPWCTWCGATNDLCADHIIPGHPEHGVRTLCRPCNTRRRNGAPEPNTKRF